MLPNQTNPTTQHGGYPHYDYKLVTKRTSSHQVSHSCSTQYPRYSYCPRCGYGLNPQDYFGHHKRHNYKKKHRQRNRHHNHSNRYYTQNNYYIQNNISQDNYYQNGRSRDNNSRSQNRNKSRRKPPLYIPRSDSDYPLLELGKTWYSAASRLGSNVGSVFRALLS